MCFLLILLPTQNSDHILRTTIINNSLRGLRFLFRMLRAQYLSWVVHQTIVRAFNRYLFPMEDIFHVFSNVCKL